MINLDYNKVIDEGMEHSHNVIEYKLILKMLGLKPDTDSVNVFEQKTEIENV